MNRSITMLVLALPCVALSSGCSRSERSSPRIVRIMPGPNAQKEAQTALIMAKPGSVVEFAEGRFEFDSTLSLDVERVTLRGMGEARSILDFSKQAAGSGGEGIKVTSDHFTVEKLTVEGTRGDGIKVTGARGVTFRSIRVDWPGPPRTENGAYGIYPVESRDVLIEDCFVRGSSDAGIYVGQSENIIVRRNEARENVAGIEIENSVHADVYENKTTRNTGGILVFSLPELPKKHGHSCRVFDNEIVENNHPNFGKPGSIVSTLPQGSGLVILANDRVEAFNNTIRNNQTRNVSIASYIATLRKYDDPEYDPYPEGIYIHDNVIEGGGDKPAGALADLVAPLLGGRFPAILYDGIIDPKKAVNGKLPPELGIYIRNNGSADFANLNLGGLLAGKKAKISRDLAPYDGELPSPPQPVKLETLY